LAPKRSASHPASSAQHPNGKRRQLAIKPQVALPTPNSSATSSSTVPNDSS